MIIVNHFNKEMYPRIYENIDYGRLTDMTTNMTTDMTTNMTTNMITNMTEDNKKLCKRWRIFIRYVFCN